MAAFASTIPAVAAVASIVAASSVPALALHRARTRIVGTPTCRRYDPKQ
jgi:hypothetical protein